MKEKGDALMLLSPTSVLRVLAVLLVYSSASAALPLGQNPPALAAGSPLETPSRGKFLIASRELVEPTFARRVVLLLDHDESRGGIGLIINRSSRMPLAQIVPGLEQFATREDYIRSGGPVERNRLFMLVRADARLPGTEQVLADTYGSSTLRPLRDLIASGNAESAKFVVYAGYAGWAPGQLEAEIDRGDWHVAPGRSEHVFDTDAAEVWPRLIRLHGGKWVEGPRPASGLADAMPNVRAGHEARVTALQEGAVTQGGEGPGRCYAPFPRTCDAPAEAEGGTLQGLKLSKSLSFSGPVTTLQYQSPSRASLLPGA